VFQGEREMAGDNKLLGNFDLTGIPPAPRGVPQIEVTFDIDANGCVNVGASDKSTGKKQNITIQSSGGLSDAEIDRMVQDAEAKKDEDELKKNAIVAKNEAESYIHTVEKQLSDFKDKISAEDKKGLEDGMAALRTALTTDDIEEIKAKKDELQQVSWKVSSAMYGQASSSEGSSEGSGEQQSQSGDEQKKEGEEKK